MEGGIVIAYLPPGRPHRHPHIATLACWSEKRGTRVIRLAPGEYREVLNEARWDHDWYICPFDGLAGLFWDARIVVYVDSSWSTVLHEIGHVLASRRRPHRCDETRFLGWEWAWLQQLDARAWQRLNSDNLSPEHFRARLESALRVAQRRGLVDDKNRPLHLR